ncbi:alkaline phosphatase [Henriciella mobilis]|uniref:alkaline phosphatase D family protein n=1 Tax=Henriciella mobilis TaxID=2305467 RepID=UPI000E670B7A|nr:alkaline phosphatase D family protein [Henriciella mobilis]RIJ16162.1 alkaline phosphatase [Henriciella mobilis]RIJ22927.1 alkaline phosphatase [Henriciella mobilis]
MSRFSRRHFLGFSAGAAGLAACATPAGGDPLADNRPAFPGEASFDHGVASGDPLSDRVILWTRVTPADENATAPVPVSLIVARDAGLTDIVGQALAEATPGRDFTVKVDMTGLDPATQYFYQFTAKTAAGDITSPVGRTKTLAASGTDPVKFAVISCSNWQFGYFNVYDDLGRMNDLDAIIHLGDYFYEYGVDGYGAETAQELGRFHEPPMEVITLGDYRMRHAQYKSDPKAQAAHAAAPWLCTWDDHESTNNAYRTGAENHQPETEGNWTDRKQAAVQAYMEWMPVRDVTAGREYSAIYRQFDFGDLATVFCLESRLTGRSDEISWGAELAGVAPEEVPDKAMEVMGRVSDESRTMLGGVQEAWLDKGLKSSVSSGKAWQVLANQVIMANVKPPNLVEALTPEQQAAQTGYVAGMIPFSQLGLPFNLDAWDGFPAARERLYYSAATAGARLVTFTGDTHTAWANELHDKAGALRGVEFGCTSVTSPGMGKYVKDVPDLGEMFAEANEDVEWFDPNGHGYILVTLDADAVTADYFKVSTVLEETYSTEKVASFVTRRDGEAMTALAKA